MKSRLWFLLLFASVVASTRTAGAPVERFPWENDLAQARERAALENKPLLIVFRCEP
jgi:hypothetical protein